MLFRHGRFQVWNTAGMPLVRRVQEVSIDTFEPVGFFLGPAGGQLGFGSGFVTVFSQVNNFAGEASEDVEKTGVFERVFSEFLLE